MIEPSPEIIVYPPEAALLLGEGSPAKDGLQVDPLALDLVQVLQVLVKVCQSLLPDGGLVRKALVVGRVLQGLQETLVITNLENDDK